jgi:probable rRNA maturation factor
MNITRRSASDAALRSSGPAGAPIEVLNRQRTVPIDRPRAAQLARAVLSAIGREAESLHIIFVKDRRMRELNRTYRGIDRPTDVLSFAYHETADPEELLVEPGYLGDLVISVETAAKYAAEAGMEFSREIDQLVIHGTLHLAGYDHETDHGEMNRLERRLRQRLLPPGTPSSPSTGPEKRTSTRRSWNPK